MPFKITMELSENMRENTLLEVLLSRLSGENMASQMQRNKFGLEWSCCFGEATNTIMHQSKFENAVVYALR